MKRVDRLKGQLVRSIESARSNRFHGMPAWACEGIPLDTPIVCCGTGHWASAFLHYARKVEVLGVVDDFHAGSQIMGLPCLDTDGLFQLVQQRPEIVCINTGQSDAGYSHFERLGIERKLKMLSYFQAVRAFHVQTDIRVADWLDPIVSRFDEYMEMEPLLFDELSVETLYSSLLYHLETDREYLLASNRPGDTTYFRSGLFEIRSSEVYVDCGSYDGDSVLRFLQVAKGRFKKTYAFEPDPGNFDRMQKRLGRAQDDRIILRQEAVGTKAGTVLFNQTGGEGACVPLFDKDNQPLVGVAESIQVRCVCLDDAVIEPISLLKLDVEGHEFDILRGARRHLIDSKPKVAACAYHLPGDLIDLPRFIRDLDAGYRIGLRHHSNTRYDTVLYAFQEE